MKQINFKMMQKILKENGYILDRVSGSHHIYINNGRHIAVNKNLNPCVALRLVKENNLIF